MKLKNLRTACFFTGILAFNTASAQLVIDNAQFFIQPGASVTVQGDVTSNANIQGTGKLVLNGAANQNINMGGFTIPNLELNNTANVTLTGNVKIGTTMLFTAGKVLVGNNTFTLAPGSTVTGAGANKFLETNGTGYVRRELTADIANAVIPLGVGGDYTPVAVSNTGSTYAAASIGAQAKGVANTHKHPRSESFLTVNWPINKVGITSGTTTAVGTYVPSRVTGTEADLVGIYWNGTTWTIAGGTQNAAQNTAGATISGTAGELYAMNSFVLVSPKAFLQGPYNNVTGRMNDRLRTNAAYVPGVLPASNLLPTTDPYRTPTYNFTHVNNTVAENVISTAFANPFIDQANADNNIVDWVYLELRTATTPGNTILQTRSALLQRDGDIVDIDGVSPVYFKKVTLGANYTLAVRHRNHLAMSTNPATFTQALNLTTASLNLSGLATASVTGVANTNYVRTGAINMLYAGNSNSNTNVRWSAPSSDKDFILSTVLSNSAVTVLSNVYSRGDMDMNRGVRWSAPNSDKDYILSTPLSNNSATVKSQVLPN